MYRARNPLNAVFLLWASSILTAGNIIYVDADSPADPGSGTYTNPFRKIQDAIDAAADGDVVEIRPGVYTGYRNYDLNPADKSITIRSIDAPNALVSTIIDPNGAGRGFFFYSSQASVCIVSGITIRNGYAQDSMGGGICCYYASPVIMNCVIENNIADLYGGGVYSYNSSLKLIQCVIRNNQAVYDGGGLELSGGAPEILNCIIANNYAAGYGGGGDIFFYCEALLKNCVFVKNEAFSGGAISCTDSQAVITSSILWENRALNGPQISMEYSISPSSALVAYSTVQGGQSEIFDPCSVLVWGAGNIIANPSFVSFDPNMNPQTWDFHLQSAYGRWDSANQAWTADPSTSPCIDSGDPNEDWSKEPWPNGRRINMGAFGGTRLASKSGNRSDFNVDNTVDVLDLYRIAEQWMAGYTCIEDLNLDGKVNHGDFSLFASDWLWKKPAPADLNTDGTVNLMDFSSLTGR